jgi:hypothetical protein
MTSYSSATEFGQLGVAANYLAGLSVADQNASLAVGYDTCNGYFRAGGYPVPIPTANVGFDVKRAECAVAAWTTIDVDGAEPDSESDKALRQAYEDAIKWLEGVAARKILPFPADLEETVPETERIGGGVELQSDDQRGWGA